MIGCLDKARNTCIQQIPSYASLATFVVGKSEVKTLICQ